MRNCVARQEARGIEEGDGVSLGGRGVEIGTVRGCGNDTGEPRTLARRYTRHSQRLFDLCKKVLECLRGHTLWRVVHGISLVVSGGRGVWGVKEVLEVPALALQARAVQLEENTLPRHPNDDVAIVVPKGIVIALMCV